MFLSSTSSAYCGAPRRLSKGFSYSGDGELSIFRGRQAWCSSRFAFDECRAFGARKKGTPCTAFRSGNKLLKFIF